MKKCDCGGEITRTPHSHWCSSLPMMRYFKRIRKKLRKELTENDLNILKEFAANFSIPLDEQALFAEGECRSIMNSDNIEQYSCNVLHCLDKSDLPIKSEYQEVLRDFNNSYEIQSKK